MDSLLSNLVEKIYDRNISATQIKFMCYLIKDADTEFNIEDVSMKFEMIPSKLLKEARSFQYIPDCFEYRINDKSISFAIFEKHIQMNLNKKTNKIVAKKEEEDFINNQIEEAFNLWAKVCECPRARLDAKRKTEIKKAISIYGFDMVLKTIEGCSKTLWNMGYDTYGNPTNKKYVDLSLIFRDAEKVERFYNNYSLNPLEEQLQNLNQNKFVSKRVDNNLNDDWLQKRLDMLDN